MTSKIVYRSKILTNLRCKNVPPLQLRENIPERLRGMLIKKECTLTKKGMASLALEVV